jgi:hypothetical protein
MRPPEIRVEMISSLSLNIAFLSEIIAFLSGRTMFEIWPNFQRAL